MIFTKPKMVLCKNDLHGRAFGPQKPMLCSCCLPELGCQLLNNIGFRGPNARPWWFITWVNFVELWFSATLESKEDFADGCRSFSHLKKPAIQWNPVRIYTWCRRHTLPTENTLYFEFRKSYQGELNNTLYGLRKGEFSNSRGARQK